MLVDLVGYFFFDKATIKFGFGIICSLFGMKIANDRFGERDLQVARIFLAGFAFEFERVYIVNGL